MAEINKQKQSIASPASSRNSEELLLRPRCEWPYRLIGNLFILGIIAVISAIILTLKNDVVNKRLVELKESFYTWAGEQGLRLDDIIVSGRNRTTKKEIELALGVKRGDNMLKLDIYNLKKSMEQLPWIKQVDIERNFFPNILNIKIEEKHVVAIWQLQEKFYPIDEEGKIIKAPFRTREPILLIVGAGAPDNLKELITVMKNNNPDYLNRIKVANFISNRRWNLILDDIISGITIKLPEENLEQAWKKLIDLNESKGILKRKLTIIDLRLPHKIVVKLRKTEGEPPPELNTAAERKI